MKRFQLMTAAAAASLIAAGPAFAGAYTEGPADPVVITPAPVVTQTGNWTGFYAGGSLGYGNLDFAESDDALTYGVHAGYDYDFGTFVMGGEAEYMARDMWENNAADSTRLKARFGYDMGETMVYGVAGGSMIDDQWGYNVGFGAEHMLTSNWSVGAEYLYENISDYNDTQTDLTGNTVAARVNYRF
ncbi:outer membrane protein [Pseudooceanicola sp. HF7]|uniref:outer membrane protein n=1 Tax=Pseudooceanicola sp. HF7 TaxID=2721560 RepID=UPI001430BD32|nr:porin family protein [Pseudooceanicola sp. HF7]NIZ11018.1 porin family protein [Pseudooceanicola sp. HF7]